MREPRRSVRIIECSDNRGFTVCGQYMYVCTKHSQMPKWVKLVFFLLQVYLWVSIITSCSLIVAGPWEHVLVDKIRFASTVHSLFRHVLPFWPQRMCKAASGHLYKEVCPRCAPTRLWFKLIHSNFDYPYTCTSIIWKLGLGPCVNPYDNKLAQLSESLALVLV